MSDEYLILSPFARICTVCGGKIEKKDIIMYNTFHKSVRHVKCKKETKEVKQNEVG